MNSIKIESQSFKVELASDTDTTEQLADVFAKIVKTAPPVLTIIEKKTAEPRPALPTTIADVANQVENNAATETSPPVKNTKKRVARGHGERAIAYPKLKELIKAGSLDDFKGADEIRNMLVLMGFGISSDNLPYVLLMLTRENWLVRRKEDGKFKYKRAESLPETAPEKQAEVVAN